MVLELGMNHKGEIKKLSEIAEPVAGLITNIGYAHIGQLGSLSAIAECKSEIYEGINPHGYIFLNRDDTYFEYLKNKSPVEVIDYGISDFTVLEDKILDGYRLCYNGIEFSYPLPGRHNLSNLAGALKVAEFYKIDENKIAEIIENTKAVSGRSEPLQGF
jgi:UDP-N-acetylmuramoyl-tripeptide--D-alanyl-D-alanine ligase